MTTIGGYILRCFDRKATAKFYEKLGLKINEHQHDGPLHFEVAPAADEIVMELYNSSDKYPQDTVMILVESVKKSITKLRKLGIEPRLSVVSSGGHLLVFYTDPDGRDVMLFQRKKNKSKRK